MRNKLMWTVNVILIGVLVFLVILLLSSSEDDEESGSTTTTTTTTEPTPEDEWIPDGPNADQIRDLAAEVDSFDHLSDYGDDWELGIVKEPMEETMSVVTSTETLLLQGKFSGCGENLAPDYFRGLFTPGDLILWSDTGGDNVICGQEIHLVHDVQQEEEDEK